MQRGRYKCGKCNRLKRKHLFHRDNSRKSGVGSYCKSCKRKIDSERNRFYGDLDESGNVIYTVYYLPEEHYVGMTKDLLHRMKDHRKKGKIIEGYEIVGQYSDPKVAHLLETQLHYRGYHGFQYKG